MLRYIAHNMFKLKKDEKTNTNSNSGMKDKMVGELRRLTHRDRLKISILKRINPLSVRLFEKTLVGVAGILMDYSDVLV